MSIELTILKSFCEDKNKYLLHETHISELKEMDRDVKQLFNTVSLYYTEHEDAQFIDKDTLCAYYEVLFPKSRNRDDIISIINTTFDISISNVVIDHVLDQLNEKYTANKVVNLLLPVLEGDKYGVIPEVKAVIEDYIDEMNYPPEQVIVPAPCDKSPRQLIKEEILTPGLSWRSRLLNDIVGGIKPSTLGLIYAYVDSGKTSFHLDNVASFSEQLPDDGRPICICGNEEKAERLKTRLIQAYLKVSMRWLNDENNLDEMEYKLSQTSYNKVHVFDEIITGDQIKYILKEYNPHILVVDQATDIDIRTRRKADGVEYMKQLFKWYRRLANVYKCAILGVSQGVGDAENTKWLKLSDIYGSRSAIQGSLDYAIGIGRKINDIILENIRYINVPKNKLYGGEGGHITLKFTKQNCLWEET